jgi:hypothetical protein
MGIKLGKSAKLPADALIGTGIIFCVLSVVLFLMGAFNVVTNGFVLGGGGVLGLLMICAGYLKRIAAAVTAAAESAPAADH